MKTKILLLSIGVILILAIGAGAFWWMQRPQVVTFSDDATITLLKVDYGKRHTPPPVKSTTGTRTRRPNSFTTTNDTLVLWVRQQYDSKQYHYFQYYVYDTAGNACVQTFGYGGNNSGNDVVGVRIDSFPRRQGKFIVRVQENGNGNDETAEKPFIIHNPAKKSFASWTPELLPTTKSDDDLSVTLTKLISGVQNTYTRGDSDPDDALNKAIQATFHVERNGKPVTNWQPVTVTTSDATGNEVHGWVTQNHWQNGDDTVTYQYGLWPDEPAWKIRLEFSQQSDFAESELWNVPNVPLRPAKQQEMWNYGGRRNTTTNAPIAETDLNGFHIKLFPAKQFTDVGPNSNPQGGLFVEVSPNLNEGFRMTVKVTDDQTNEVNHWDYGSNGNGTSTTYRYGLQDLSGLTNLNVSIALHKSRFVEFTAKPEKTSETADAAQ